MADGAYGSTFFFATGFHGIHVMIGTAFIAVSFFRILSYHLTDHHHLGFEAAILYWLKKIFNYIECRLSVQTVRSLLRYMLEQMLNEIVVITNS